MASENRCPKCGEPLVPNPSFHGVFDCPKCDEGFPLDPKDCRIKELERQLEEAKAEAEKEERRHLETIDRRDAAEEACSQMYYLITGNSPHWSNVFGYAQAIEDVDDTQIALHAWGKAGDEFRVQLAAAQDTIQQQARELEEADWMFAFMVETAGMFTALESDSDEEKRFAVGLQEAIRRHSARAQQAEAKEEE